jgi:hypothetical protein
MHRASRTDESNAKEIVGRISESLLTLFLTLSSANVNISLYHYHHLFWDIRRNRSEWNQLDETYTIYEEQAKTLGGYGCNSEQPPRKLFPQGILTVIVHLYLSLVSYRSRRWSILFLFGTSSLR